MTYPSEIQHLSRCKDLQFEYKIIALPKEVYLRLPQTKRLFSEKDIRNVGVVQSEGWEHYFSLPHERHVLMMRRDLPDRTPRLRQRRKSTLGDLLANGTEEKDEE